jgi:hypothetical protein
MVREMAAYLVAELALMMVGSMAAVWGYQMADL